MRFKRRVTHIEAWQFTGDNGDLIATFAGPALRDTGQGLELHTPSGAVPLVPGDYVAQNPRDPTDFYPIKAAQFAELYDREP